MGRRTDVSNSPTVLATTPGLIVGTAAYMSPEQANGKDADRSADVWAFGCVLYEMLTGQRAFAGDTVSEILANVLKSEPAWERLPAATPSGIRRLLRRCLQKDQKLRIRDIHDARLELADAQSATPDAGGQRCARTTRAAGMGRRRVDGARRRRVGCVESSSGSRSPGDAPCDHHASNQRTRRWRFRPMG